LIEVDFTVDVELTVPPLLCPSPVSSRDRSAIERAKKCKRLAGTFVSQYPFRCIFSSGL